MARSGTAERSQKRRVSRVTFLIISRKFKNNCKNSCAFIVEFVCSLSISEQTHEDASPSKSEEFDNLLCKRQIDIRFHASVFDNEFRQNIVKVVCR